MYAGVRSTPVTRMPAVAKRRAMRPCPQGASRMRDPGGSWSNPRISAASASECCVVDRLRVEVRVVVAEGAPPRRTSCAIFAAGRVPVRAAAPGPLFRRGDRRRAHGRPRRVRDHDPRAVDRRRQAERRLPLGAPGPGRPGHRPRRQRLDLGGRVIVDHLPAAARPRTGESAHDAVAPGPLGSARSGSARAGGRRPGGRRVRPGGAARPIRRPATTGWRRSRRPNPRIASASPPGRRRCPRGDAGGDRTPARPRDAPLLRLGPAAGDAG